MFKLFDLKPQVVAILVGAVMAVGVAVAITIHIRGLISDAYDDGRAEVLLEIRERTVELTERLQAADRGQGDADEDLAWIDRELERLGLQLVEPDPDASPGTR